MISAPVGDQEINTVHLKEKRVRKKIQITSEWKQTKKLTKRTANKCGNNVTDWGIGKRNQNMDTEKSKGKYGDASIPKINFRNRKRMVENVLFWQFLLVA